jgi:asparagine synthase (glutamine-hydrolysing)
MCGIAGFAGPGDALTLKAMTRALIHRGPDAEGYWSEPAQGVYIGHRRLTILDPEGGAQPMWTADGRIGIVYNGEIYNFLELRKELENAGHRFLSDHSDTEVLLYGYRQWGFDVTKRLNGMWAFVIVDRDRHVLFCSRDRFGKKPFYYVNDPQLFAFASEVSALVCHPHVQPRTSRDALKKYFAYGFLPAPYTIFQGVRKLPGGCSLVFDLKTRAAKVIRYWEFVLEPDETRPQGYEDACAEEVLTLLDKAVRRRLVCDVPIGVFLSGGIDSSAVASIAARHVPKGALKTFSIAFEEAEYDESAYARQVASHIGSEHGEETMSVERARDLLTDIFSRIDEPLGDSSLLPTFLLCRHARRFVTVALGGDGADELFAGYAPFKALRWARLYKKVVGSSLHAAILAVVSRLPVSHGYLSLDLKLKRTLRGLSYAPRLWNPIWMSPLNPSELDELFGEPLDLEEVFSEAIDAWERHPADNDVDRTLQFFTRLYLQEDILTKVDRASMLNSLEVRAPFLDIDLVDRVRRIPSSFKLRGQTSKYILRKALRGLLSDATLMRPKQGFAVPIASWFAKHQITLRRQPMQAVNNAFAMRKLQEHVAGVTDHRWFLWNQWALDEVRAQYSARVS